MNDILNSDSATVNAVGDGMSNPIFNEASLARAFMSETVADTQEVVDSESVVEEPQALEEPEEDSITEEPLIAETDEDLSAEFKEDEEEEVEESEKGDVLSKSDKSLKKMRKSINKATKKFKTAEETIESRDKEIQELKDKISGGSNDTTSSEKSFKDIAEDADSIDDLQAVYDKAKKAEKWVKKAMRDLSRSGQDSLFINDVEYTFDQIEKFEEEIDSALNTDIPAREQMFTQRKSYDAEALKAFPFLGDPESDGFKQIEGVMQNTKLSQAFASLPEQSYLYGLLAEGLLSLNAKQKQSTTEVDNTEGAIKKSAPTQKLAPKIPFGGSNVANARHQSSDRSNRIKAEIGRRSNIGPKELTKLFM